MGLCGPRRTGPVVQLHRRAQAYREAATRQRNEVVIGPVMSLLLSLARSLAGCSEQIRVYFSSVVQELALKKNYILLRSRWTSVRRFVIAVLGPQASLRTHEHDVHPPDMALGD